MPTLEKLSMKPLRTSSVSDALMSSNPAFAVIRKAKGRDSAMTLLAAIITNGLKYFNVGKGMTPEQVVLAADLILTDFHYLKPDEVAMTFRMAASGRFGKIYDRIDPAVIMEWMAEFDSFRTIEAENISIKASNKPATQLLIESSDNIPLDVKEAFKRLYSENEKKHETKKELPRNDERVQGWLRQFDKIVFKQSPKGAIKIIRRYGRMMDVSEFLNYKINQFNNLTR